MWLLAGLMTFITLFVGIGFFYIATYFELHRTKEQMPSKARAELEQLIATGQRGSDRYYEIYDRYSGDVLRTDDVPFLALIALISTLVGGSFAFILARRISRPITAVTKAAALVASGDRSARVNVEGASGETAELVESFNRMACDIEAYERERTVLTAGIAHELRTPLTILNGRLHGLIDGVIDTQAGEAHRLLRQVEQLSRVVEDLRTLAHADAGQLELDFRLIDLAQLARVVVADLRQAGEQTNFELDCETAIVRADEGRLTQILMNLLTNAVKHTPENGVIAVSVRIEENWAIARISDQGPGFREEDRQRLFTPFWRAGQNRAAGRIGSGMGLALAAKLAEAQGGSILAANKSRSRGAVFTVRLPAVRTRSGPS